MNQSYEIYPQNRLFELYNFLNKENIPESRAIALREIDLTRLIELRNSLEVSGRKPSYTSFIAKACAQVLREMPEVNRATIELPFYKRIFSFKNTHISVAVERNDAKGLSGGAFVYTIYETDIKSVQSVSDEINGLAKLSIESIDSRLERWKRMQEGVKKSPFTWIIQLVVMAHKNIPSLYLKNRGGALMISSPSKYGVDFIVAHWPYTLGVSFGFIKERPWVENHQLVIRKTTTITLAFDRRLVPGAQAAQFLNRLCEILENPVDHFKN